MRSTPSENPIHTAVELMTLAFTTLVEEKSLDQTHKKFKFVIETMAMLDQLDLGSNSELFKQQCRILFSFILQEALRAFEERDLITAKEILLYLNESPPEIKTIVDQFIQLIDAINHNFPRQLQAYEKFLEGRQHFLRFDFSESEWSVLKAIDCYQKAIELCKENVPSIYRLFCGEAYLLYWIVLNSQVRLSNSDNVELKRECDEANIRGLLHLSRCDVNLRNPVTYFAEHFITKLHHGATDAATLLNTYRSMRYVFMIYQLTTFTEVLKFETTPSYFSKIIIHWANRILCLNPKDIDIALQTSCEHMNLHAKGNQFDKTQQKKAILNLTDLMIKMHESTWLIGFHHKLLFFRTFDQHDNIVDVIPYVLIFDLENQEPNPLVDFVSDFLERQYLKFNPGVVNLFVKCLIFRVNNLQEEFETALPLIKKNKYHNLSDVIFELALLLEKTKQFKNAMAVCACVIWIVEKGFDRNVDLRKHFACYGRKYIELSLKANKNPTVYDNKCFDIIIGSGESKAPIRYGRPIFPIKNCPSAIDLFKLFNEKMASLAFHDAAKIYREFRFAIKHRLRLLIDIPTAKPLESKNKNLSQRFHLKTKLIEKRKDKFVTVPDRKNLETIKLNVKNIINNIAAFLNNDQINLAEEHLTKLVFAIQKLQVANITYEEKILFDRVVVRYFLEKTKQVTKADKEEKLSAKPPETPSSELKDELPKLSKKQLDKQTIEFLNKKRAQYEKKKRDQWLKKAAFFAEQTKLAEKQEIKTELKENKNPVEKKALNFLESLTPFCVSAFVVGGAVREVLHYSGQDTDIDLTFGVKPNEQPLLVAKKAFPNAEIFGCDVTLIEEDKPNVKKLKLLAKNQNPAIFIVKNGEHFYLHVLINEQWQQPRALDANVFKKLAMPAKKGEPTTVRSSGLTLEMFEMIFIKNALPQKDQLFFRIKQGQEVVDLVHHPLLSNTTLTEEEILHVDAYGSSEKTSQEILKKLNDKERKSLPECRGRDFTFNAIYLNSSRKMIDPTGRGIHDALKRRIRTIIPANDSFLHDPIRVLRTIYDTTKKNDKLTTDLAKIIKALPANLFNHLIKQDPHKLNAWMQKLFMQGFAEKNFKLLRELNLFEKLFPAFAQQIKEHDCVLGYLIKTLQTADHLTHRAKEASKKAADSKLTPHTMFKPIQWPNFDRIYLSWMYAIAVMPIKGLIDQNKLQAMQKPERLLVKKSHYTGINIDVRLLPTLFDKHPLLKARLAPFFAEPIDENKLRWRNITFGNIAFEWEQYFGSDVTKLIAADVKPDSSDINSRRAQEDEVVRKLF